MNREIAKKIYSALNSEELDYFINNNFTINIIEDIRNLRKRVQHLDKLLYSKDFDLDSFIIDNNAEDLLEVLEGHFVK